MDAGHRASSRRTGRGSSSASNHLQAHRTSGSASGSSSTASATSRASTWSSRSSACFRRAATTRWPPSTATTSTTRSTPTPRTHNGQKHPLAERSLNLVWLKVPDTAAFNRVATQIEDVARVHQPGGEVRNGVLGHRRRSWKPFRDLIWGMRWLLAPACLVTLSLVIANAISISVRERRMELAVLKVLGFRPYRFCPRAGRIAVARGVAGLLSAGA